MSSEIDTRTEAIEAGTIRKVRTRILPFLFLLYIICFLDRINIGFAALTMNKELAITSQQFGLLAGIFFFGYLLFGVPSNLLLHKVGAGSCLPRHSSSDGGWWQACPPCRSHTKAGRLRFSCSSVATRRSPARTVACLLAKAFGAGADCSFNSAAIVDFLIFPFYFILPWQERTSPSRRETDIALSSLLYVATDQTIFAVLARTNVFPDTRGNFFHASLSAS
jgi:hypothetical protein